MYITGNVSTSGVIDITGIYLNPPPKDAILSRVSAEQGIPVSGLSAYFVVDTNTRNRVMAGDQFNPVWSGVAWQTLDPSGVILASGVSTEIVNLDFSPQDSKRWLKFTSNKTEIIANGTDTATIKVQLLNANKTPNTTITTSQNVTMMTPTGPAQAKVSVVNGSGTFNFATVYPGYWKFPGDLSKFPNLRLDTSVEVLSLLNIT